MLNNRGLSPETIGEDIYHPNRLSLLFQGIKDDDMCEEEELVGNGTNNSANRKRQMWWESRQGTDEKNVREGQCTHDERSIDYGTSHEEVMLWLAIQTYPVSHC